MRIILADDHALFREGLKLMLQSQMGMIVVAEVDTLEQVAPTINRCESDLLILDYHMPGGESSAVLAYCKQRYPQLKIMALTGTKSGVVLKQLQDANADAVLLKDSPPAELLEAIRHIIAGKKVISNQVQTYIEETKIELTSRELQILQLIYAGTSSADAAKQLHLSVKTVDKHRENIMRKFQVANVVQLIHKVQMLELLPKN
jgi:DNA-binding NarL/FixJ family response regulator